MLSLHAAAIATHLLAAPSADPDHFRKRVLANSPIDVSHVQGTSTTVVSPDKRHVAYVVAEGGKFRAVIGELLGREYDFVTRLHVGSGGEPHAYVVNVGGKADDGFRGGRFFPVVNGVPLPGDPDRIPHLSLVEPRNVLALALGRSTDESAWVRIGNTDGAMFERVTAPSFSKDGMHSVYLGFRKGSWIAVVDGAEIPGEAPGDQAVMSPDGERIVFVKGTEGSRSVVSAKRASLEILEREGPWLGAWTPVWSESGKHRVFGMKDSDGYAIRGVGKTIRATGAYRKLAVSNDGRAAWVVAEASTSRVFLEGKPVPGVWDEIGSIGFSENGKRLLAIGRRGKESFIEIDGKVAAGPFSWISSAVFSEGGAVLAVHHSSDDDDFVRIGGKDYGPYSWVGGIEATAADDAVGFATRTGDTFVWRIVPLTGDSAEWQIVRGRAELRAGNPAAAEKAFDAALKLAPGDFEAHNLRGIAKQKQGNVVGALADFEAAIRAAPGYLSARRNRAATLGEAKRIDEAIATLDEALKHHPLEAGLLTERAAHKSDRGDRMGAMADLTKAIELRPSYARALVDRSALKFSLGDYGGALADTDRAIAADEKRAVAHFNRAETLLELGRKEEACAAWSRAGELGESRVYKRLQAECSKPR